MDDRRRHPRSRLDAPLFCDLTSKDLDAGLVCIVRDVAAGGLRVELPPEGPRPRLGSTVRLANFDAPAASGLEGIEAEVVWASGRECGLRFVNPSQISEDTVAAVLKAGAG